MDLPGCETTVKSINNNPISASRGNLQGESRPVDKPDRMTQNPVNNNNTCCSGSHAAHRIPGLKAVS